MQNSNPSSLGNSTIELQKTIDIPSSHTNGNTMLAAVR